MTTRKVYDPVWECIYCGKPHTKDEPLGREHIVPYFLIGEDGLILPRASCICCSEKTRDFEKICARDLFGTARIVTNAPTRNPDERPKHLPATVIQDGTSTEVQIPIENYPYLHLNFFQFGLCNLITGKQWTGGQMAKLRSIDATLLNVKTTTPPSAEVEVYSKLDPVAFFKLLCKIAHGYAIAIHGVKSHQWLLPDLIRGLANNFSDFVGGGSALPQDIPESLLPPGLNSIPTGWNFVLSCGPVRGARGIDYLAVKIGLFYDFVPPYWVIVAKA
jgi:hypothetical protein